MNILGRPCDIDVKRYCLMCIREYLFNYTVGPVWYLIKRTRMIRMLTLIVEYNEQMYSIVLSILEAPWIYE